MAELEADAAAARGTLQHHRIADITGPCQRIVEIDDERRTGKKRHTALLGNLARRMLEREGAHMFRPRADKGNAFARECRRKFRILAEKAVTGVNGFCTRLPHRRENGFHVEIAFGDRRRADADSLIREMDMRREAVRLGVNGDGPDAHPPERLDDAQSDFAAIGDQNLVEHLASSGTRR